MKAIKNFIKNSLECLAPYMVRNAHFGKLHLCWTRKAALEWMACYDAADFGTTELFGFNGELIGHVAAA
jgi:hypothetical protein